MNILAKSMLTSPDDIDFAVAGDTHKELILGRFERKMRTPDRGKTAAHPSGKTANT
jgi:hypothetical protein